MRLMEVAEQTLASGFQEQGVEHIKERLHVTRKDIPWLPKGTEEEDINLVRVPLVGGGEFYFGNFIREDRLLRAAHALDANGQNKSQICNNILYSRLPTFIREGSHPGVRPVDERKTRWAMYEAGNRDGERVFFFRTRLDKLQDTSVIIRIAVCDKSMEAKVVLPVITYSSKKRAKQTTRT